MKIITVTFLSVVIFFMGFVCAQKKATKKQEYLLELVKNERIARAQFDLVVFEAINEGDTVGLGRLVSMRLTKFFRSPIYSGSEYQENFDLLVARGKDIQKKYCVDACLGVD